MGICVCLKMTLFMVIMVISTFEASNFSSTLFNKKTKMNSMQTLNTINPKHKPSCQTPPLSIDVSNNIANFHFDENRVRELISRMILYHEYPFMHMEYVLYNKVMKACTPHWRKIF